VCICGVLVIYIAVDLGGTQRWIYVYNPNPSPLVASESWGKAVPQPTTSQ